MNQTEFREKLSKTINTNWYNSVEFNLQYPHLDLNFEFKGFANIHRFVRDQIKGWENLSSNLPHELNNSKNHFERIENELSRFVEINCNQSSIANLESHLNELKRVIKGKNTEFFPYNTPETEFLIDVHNNFSKSFLGAYSYLIGSLDQNIAVKDNFNGYLMAYEFASKDSTRFTQRRNREKSSLAKLRNGFENTLHVLDKQLVEHLKNSTSKYEEYGNAIEVFKLDKEKTYSDWYINAKGDFEQFSNKSDERLNELEETYKKKLQLSEPATYWSGRAEKLKTQAWIALFVVVSLVLIVVVSLGILLWTPPEHIYTSFFNEDKSTAIRWSIIYITFISFLAYAIRAVTKVMFSSFHLARDCEERYTLTYFYLSLLKDSNVEPEERQLIIQSLFSRAETGLLKDDSSPTMPNDVISKFINK